MTGRKPQALVRKEREENSSFTTIMQYLQEKHPELNIRENDKRGEYLSLRIMGFTTSEAMRLADVRHKLWRKWRSSVGFKDVDDDEILEIRQQLAPKVIWTDFIRNLYLVFYKDRKVLEASLFDQDKMSEMDKEYLLKLRNHYDPRQFGEMQASLAGTTAKERKPKENWNFFLNQFVNSGNKQSTPSPQPAIDVTANEVNREG